MKSPSQNQAVLQQVQELAVEFAQTYPLRDQRNEFPHEEMAKLKQSGLLALSIPEEYGGLGLSFVDTIESVRMMATGNPSIAQMYAGHVLMVSQTIDHLAPEALKRRIFQEVIENQAFLANASSERHSKHIFDWQTTFTPAPGKEGIPINGKKFFSTGSLASDFLFVPGMLNGDVAVAFVPTNTEGLVIHNDWNAMGQRGTASGTSEFTNVYVAWEWIIPRVGSMQEPDPTDFFAPMIQAGFTAVYVGTAQAALAHALAYVKTKSRPWTPAGVNTAVEDPYILQDIGKMQAYVAAASLLRDATGVVEHALALRGKVGREELARHRAEAMVKIAEAKVVATEVALRVCLDIFKVCGTRSALAEEDADRFLRDMRTLTLHDPVEYKAKLIGEYLLQGRPPCPSFVT